MIEIFFESIPTILFEPIAVGAALGLLTALFVFWKKHTPLYWIIIIAVLFMIGWRMAIQIVSSRYASILLYPGVIATAYFCLQLENLTKIIPKIPGKVTKLLPWMFLIGLSVASFVKALHYNPYENYIRHNCSAARKDAAAFSTPLAITSQDEVRRLRYYSGIKTIGTPALDFPKNIPDPTVIRPLLKHYSKQCDVLYFFLDESSSSVPLSPAALGVASDQWKLLSQQYQNRRKKKLLRLYRYLPTQKQITPIQTRPQKKPVAQPSVSVKKT